MISVKKERFLWQQQEQQQPQTLSPAAPAAVSVAAELVCNVNHSTDGSLLACGGPPPSQDPGVVVVHYVEGTAPRTLPSQARLWVPYCPACQAPLLKGEDGVMEACRSCGHTTRERWTLVRRFEQLNKVSMELTPDDTLVLRGVDAASAYLFRAGFQRTLFRSPANGDSDRSEAASTGGNSLSSDSGVWTTSLSLTRMELDFLEACCQRIACGEGVDDLGATVPVPAIFRIPRRRQAGGDGRFYSFRTTQPQSQSQMVYHGGGGAGSTDAAVRPSLPLPQRSQVSPYYPLSATP